MSEIDVGEGQPEVRPPRVWASRRELRMPFELVNSVARTRVLRGWPRGDGHSVVVVPGFLAGAESTAFLRNHLGRLGYQVSDWGLGRNSGVTRARTEAFARRVAELRERSGRKVSIVGWSAGGIYAREMGRLHPDQVRCVITMVTPFNVHLTETPAWKLYLMVNRGSHDETLFTDEVVRLRGRPLSLPTTSIYTKDDGIIAWQSCVGEPAPLNEAVEVRGSHLGTVHQIDSIRVIADRLAQPEGDWRPYAQARDSHRN